MTEYLFKSERLGFRNWKGSDLEAISAINADERVMEFFPSTKTKDETKEFIGRMQKQFLEKGYCYFATELLENNEFIGFIGLSEQNFDADFTPCIDIGWRLKYDSWNKGLATEGASAVLNYGFRKLDLKIINAIAPVNNLKSVHIMEKIGMKKVKTFDHPLLKNHERLKKCILFEAKT